MSDCRCVICGAYIPEGEGMVCKRCEQGDIPINIDQFCEIVIKYLKTEYSSDYKYDTARYVDPPSPHSPYHEVRVEIIIRTGENYQKKLSNAAIHYLFQLYDRREFLEDRNQYLWQKELVDMIEGN